MNELRCFRPTGVEEIVEIQEIGENFHELF
jgi:hypothetical protein